MEFLDIYSASHALYKLERSGQVILRVKGGVAHVKRGYPDPLLMLQTTEHLNMGKGGLVCTLVGYGCKILDRQNFKATPLILIGLTSVAAKLLINELKILKI